MHARSSTRSSWRVGSTWWAFLNTTRLPGHLIYIQVRNEIAVLKRISSGNRNVVTLHDYFEVRVGFLERCLPSSTGLRHCDQTAHNLYLCFDLCTGGELFDRICAKGNYYEADAADLVRTIMRAVKYIHSAGIVHRGESRYLGIGLGLIYLRCCC